VVIAGFTEFAFESGFTVEVNGNEVEFGVPVDGVPEPGVAQCNRAVTRFLRVLTNLDLTEFSIGFRGYSEMPEGCPGITNIGTPLHDRSPIIGHRSSFYFRDRQVRFRAREVSRGDSHFINALDFRVLNSYSRDSYTGEDMSVVLEDVLEGWEELWGEFCQLSVGFYSRHIESG
jgi:hypothetical protein